MLQIGPVQLNLWTFLFTALNVLVVMWLLSRFLFKPVSEILEKRERAVRETLEAAKRQQDQATSLLREYEGKMAAAEAQAQEIVSKALHDAERLREERLQAAATEAEKLLDRARREIGEEKEKALRELREEAVELALMAASRVIGRQLSAADDRRLVSEFIGQLADMEERKVRALAVAEEGRNGQTAGDKVEGQ
ncbi:MAG: F0F1 ATP synthase subunit B [Limnochordales bacterium]|nr:F0F1 ATP synthase subunit B [Limnochordales bacterium]